MYSKSIRLEWGDLPVFVNKADVVCLHKVLEMFNIITIQRCGQLLNEEKVKHSGTANYRKNVYRFS